MISLLARLRGRGIGEIRTRGLQQAAVLLERAGLHPDGNEPDEARLRRIIRGPSDADSLLAQFRERRSPAFAAMDDPAAAAARLRERWPDDADATIERARRAANGSFDLLGYRDLSFGHPVDWQLDPVSGRRAPLEHWSRLAYLNHGAVGDHKVVWELSRHQHFVTLGQAYALTGDENFAAALAEQASQWMDANPPKLGMNWASSLEVGFRAIAWTWALHLVRHSSALDATVFRRMLGMLHVHARHLEIHLSTYFSPNTHLTGEALGLLYIGTHFPELADAPRWARLGRKTLLDELPRQVRGDGVYFEQSTYYHRYTTDFYLHLAMIERGMGRGTPKPLESALPALLDHIVATMRPDRRWPLIGDDDGGRLLMLKPRDSNDFRDTLALGGALLERPEYCFGAGEPAPELVWLLGAGGPARFERIGQAEPEVPGGFRESGFFAMRDGWGREASYLVVDCGPLGGLNAGHGHADTLAVEVVARGRPILVDPGTFTYVATAAERDAFRSSRAHSTVTVAGQSSSMPGTAFRWKHRAGAALAVWDCGSAVDYFEGSHDGYSRLVPPAVHARSILFVHRRIWVIRDVVSGGAHPFEVRWHAGIGIRVVPGTGRDLRFAGDDGAGLYLAASAGTISVESDWTSPVFGVREATQVGVTAMAAGEGDTVISVLVPVAAGDHPKVTFGDGRVTISIAGGADEVLLDGGPLRLADAAPNQS